VWSVSCNALVGFVVESRTEEYGQVCECITSVRDILSCINSQVDDHEKCLQLLDIYNRLDAQSCTQLNGITFTVSFTLCCVISVQ